MVDKFERFGPARISSCAGMGHPGVIVPVGVPVTRDLTTHHRSITSDPSTDLGEAKAAIKSTHDLDPLIETEPMAAPAWAGHITRTSQTTRPTTSD
jgi:hypothetical protein